MRSALIRASGRIGSIGLNHLRPAGEYREL
jgi:hypothetical protein